MELWVCRPESFLVIIGMAGFGEIQLPAASDKLQLNRHPAYFSFTKMESHKLPNVAIELIP